MSAQRLRSIATVVAVVACLAQVWIGDLWLALLFMWLGVSLTTFAVDEGWITKTEDRA